MNGITHAPLWTAEDDRLLQVEVERQATMNKWVSVPAWLREYEDHQTQEWTPELDSTLDLMMPERFTNRSSGISGLSERHVTDACGCEYTVSYHQVNAGWISRGRRVLDLLRTKNWRTA